MWGASADEGRYGQWCIYVVPYDIYLWRTSKTRVQQYCLLRTRTSIVLSISTSLQLTGERCWLLFWPACQSAHEREHSAFDLHRAGSTFRQRQLRQGIAQDSCLQILFPQFDLHLQDPHRRVHTRLAVARKHSRLACWHPSPSSVVFSVSPSPTGAPVLYPIHMFPQQSGVNGPLVISSTRLTRNSMLLLQSLDNTSPTLSSSLPTLPRSKHSATLKIPITRAHLTSPLLR